MTRKPCYCQTPEASQGNDFTRHLWGGPSIFALDYAFVRDAGKVATAAREAIEMRGINIGSIHGIGSTFQRSIDLDAFHVTRPAQTKASA